MKRKGKSLIAFAVFTVAFAVLTLAIHLNVHNFFLISEKNGWFLDEIRFVGGNGDEDNERLTLSDLESDPRVIFDQSLMLINTEYMLPEDFEAQVSEYKDTDVYMNDCMLDAYAALSAAVTERMGKKLYVSSDFRSSDEQEVLYLEDPLTATLPGASEHQTGLAVDVYVAYYAGDGFIKSSAGRFVNSHCDEYGFIIRYPSYGEEVTGIRFEPWHIRYVGHPHADIIYNNHITLEQYVLSMEIGTWYEAEDYRICRQPLGENDTLILPAEFTSCVISPDNTGYYIVTVK